MGRFDSVRHDDEARECHHEFKLQFERLEFLIQGLGFTDRATEQALLRLEESFMWVGKAIRNAQLARMASRIPDTS